MWRVGVKDLLYRRWRFVVSMLATSIAFALALVLAGVAEHLGLETKRVVALFGADSFVVSTGGSGPFSTTHLLSTAVADELRADPGVFRADPFIQARDTLKGRDVNVLGLTLGGAGWPRVRSGRLPLASGEVVIDSTLRYRLGDTVALGSWTAQVVGTSSETTYYFGMPTVFGVISDVQRGFLAGQPYATAIAVRGEPVAIPPGARQFTPRQAVIDLDRPQRESLQTIQIINLLLWLMAGGVIASMLYLSVLERRIDLATCKAIGVSNITLFGGLALQGVVLALAASCTGAVLASLLAPLFPFTIEIPGSAYIALFVAGNAVGLLAALIGLRRTSHIDPALAFAN